MNSFLKDKRGFVSIYMIMWMAVLIPILLFTFIDLTHYIYESKHLKSVTDNATASAVTQIKEDLVPSGVLEIDEIRAEAVALKIFKKDLLLNDDLTPKENSVLKEKPMIQMHVLNITSEEGYDFETPAGVVKIFKPSVVIYAEYPVSGLFYYRSGLLLKKVSVSQVQFKNNPVNEGNNGNEGGNEGSNSTKTYSVTTPESIQANKEYTYSIPGLKTFKGVTSNTGNVEIIRIDGENITVKVSNGSVVRTVQTGGTYIPSDTKFVTEQKTLEYNKDGYKGTLQLYDKLPPSTKKIVDYEQPLYGKIGYACRNGRWEKDGYSSNWNRDIKYSDADGYEGYIGERYGGTFKKIDMDFDTVENNPNYIDEYGLLNNTSQKISLKSPCSKEIYPEEAVYLEEDWMYLQAMGTEYFIVGKLLYSGTVQRPEASLYQGNVTRPEVDTRTYDNYYQYKLNFEYID